MGWKLFHSEATTSLNMHLMCEDIVKISLKFTFSCGEYQGWNHNLAHQQHIWHWQTKQWPVTLQEWLHRGFSLCNSTTNTGNVAWDEINPGIYQLLEISFIGRRKNRLFEYDTRRVLMFISVLSLRMEGGRERGRRGRREGGRGALCRWQDWLCVWWMGLSQTVTGLCSIHVDVQYALHPLTSREPFCPDDLQIASSLAAYGGYSRWGVSPLTDRLGAKMPNYWMVSVQINVIIYLLDLVNKCRNTDYWPFSWETSRCAWGDPMEGGCRWNIN